MSAISGSTTAFYQYFRDRETAKGAQQADGGDGTRTSADPAAAGQFDPARSAAEAPPASSGALTPAQVRDRLAALIAGQVAAGKLTDAQAAALKTSLGPDTVPPKAEASFAVLDGRAPGDPGHASNAEGTYNPSEVLATFIQNLQGGQARGASYGSTGVAPAARTASRLLDFNT